MSTALDGSYEHIAISAESGVTTVTLDRPDVHNAFNAAMIEELRGFFVGVAVSGGDDLRAVVLRGAGPSFCAGADVNWMRASLNYSRDENQADAARMAAMFAAIDTCPVPVIARVHGAALGGGVGLVAVSDIVVAEERTKFAFSEVKLGIVPAVISPFVLRKIGRSHARALFLAGERFDAERALVIGLVHVVARVGSLESEIEKVVSHVMSAAPGAVARAKSLIALVPDLDEENARDLTVRTIAELRAGPEGQEGLSAFLERRKPSWLE